MADVVVMSAENAMLAMQAGEVPARLHVEGDLHFYNQYKVAPPRALPSEELVAGSIVIHDASLLDLWPQMVRCQSLYLWAFRSDFSPDSILEFTAPVRPAVWERISLNLHNCTHLTRLPHLRGEAVRELRIDGSPLLQELPSGLCVDTLSLQDCAQFVSLPADFAANVLEISGCPRLSRLPDAVHARQVSLTGCAALQALPDDFVVTAALDLSGCIGLTRLPETIGTLRLVIAGCRGISSLPRDLNSPYINMDNCNGLTHWDDPKVTSLRQLSARGCAALESLPPNLRQVDELDLRGCVALTHLPEELRVTRWIDIGESGVKALPASAQGMLVRWNGVNITSQVAFHPETLTARQILNEENAELRRVMLERLGAERFVAEAHPEEIDSDTDTGGQRRLLRIAIPRDEPLVVLEVRDPSTGREYLLRVPPNMNTCHRAAAWIAGFDNPDDYQPLLET